MATTPTGHGYWLLASDGGVFSFGDAHFYGSTGAMKLERAGRRMGTAAGGNGYWLARPRRRHVLLRRRARSSARCPASAGARAAPRPSRSPATHTGHGYWMLLADGRVVPFGDAEQYGDAPAASQPVAFAVSPLVPVTIAVASPP